MSCWFAGGETHQIGCWGSVSELLRGPTDEKAGDDSCRLRFHINPKHLSPINPYPESVSKNTEPPKVAAGASNKGGGDIQNSALGSVGATRQVSSRTEGGPGSDDGTGSLSYTMRLCTLSLHGPRIGFSFRKLQAELRQ